MSQPSLRRKRSAPNSAKNERSNGAVEQAVIPIVQSPPNNGGIVPSTSSKSADPQLAGPQPQKPPTPSEISQKIRTLLYSESIPAKRTEICGLVNQLLNTVVAGKETANKYNWLIVQDTLGMVRNDADRIYSAINKFQERREIALIITSSGGEVEPAYLISKLCRESTTGRFIAVVPRRAKSAATLICCGADEIHMGQMSELGPIDPQFNHLPALGLKHGVEHLAELASKYPDASNMFATYLKNSVNLVNLGHYERVAESAMQYAERLLDKRVLPLKNDPNKTAKQLVYGYKDHGFVIDKAEAEQIFGDEMIKGGSAEYNLGNSIYEWVSYLERLFEAVHYNFYMYGGFDSECSFFEKNS